MKECRKFVCIADEKFNFLIPSSQVITSVYCANRSYFWDDQFIFENHTIPFVDFYNDNAKNDIYDNKKYSETALIIKNNKLFDDTDLFALITSKECKVFDIEYKDFSLFSDRIEQKIQKKGFIACYFNNNSVFYLIDLEDFLKNFFI